MTGKTAEIRPLHHGDDHEDFIRTVCDPGYTPRYYGDTPRFVAERFLTKHFAPGRGADSTEAAEIWIGVQDGIPVGYYTMLFKRWGTAKASTFVVKKEHQGRGLGRAFHATIERAYDERAGLRKIFHTAPVPEIGHLRLDLEFGYRVEGHLKDHFLDGCDELVMGRRPASWTPRDAAPAPYPSGLAEGGFDVVAPVDEAAARALAPTLTRWLSATHDPVDDAYAGALLRPAPLRQSYVATWRGEPVGLLALSRKRVKLAKALLVLDPQAPSRAAALALAHHALDLTRVDSRKLFVEVPDAATALKGLLAGLGFRREAVTESTYKEGVDMALLSRFLGGGRA